MTTSQRPRVDLDPNIFKALVIEATKQDKKPKDLIDLWVKQNVSPEVLALVDIDPLPQSTKAPEPEGDKVPFDPLPLFLERLNADERQVLQLLQTGVTARVAIGEKMGISKSKAQDHVTLIKRLGLWTEEDKDKV